MTATPQPIVVQMLALLERHFGPPPLGSEGELAHAVIKVAAKAAELKARRDYFAHLDANIGKGTG